MRQYLAPGTADCRTMSELPPHYPMLSVVRRMRTVEMGFMRSGEMGLVIDVQAWLTIPEALGGARTLANFQDHFYRIWYPEHEPGDESTWWTASTFEVVDAEPQHNDAIEMVRSAYPAVDPTAHGFVLVNDIGPNATTHEWNLALVRLGATELLSSEQQQQALACWNSNIILDVVLPARDRVAQPVF